MADSRQLNRCRESYLHRPLDKLWAAERAAGHEVLMMARSRADVEALNAEARATAQATGEVHGPAVRITDRDWQRGDLLRTRRNDRSLSVGDSHVRNGDRWRVLHADLTGLLVEGLTGRGWVVSPADYLAAHAERGWASTIDSAQGATVEVGVTLVRPGLDREHLYMALTRGRAANHAYILDDPGLEADHHAPRTPHADTQRTPNERARDVLADALARSGAQDAAHTLRAKARSRIIDQHRRAAEQAAAERSAALAIPDQHAASATLLTQRQSERAALERAQDENRHAAQTARAELAGTSRWHRIRRNDLLAAITVHTDALQRTFPETARLGREIDTLMRQVARDTREREHEQRTRAARRDRPRTDQHEPYLAPAAQPTPSLRATMGRAAALRREHDLDRAAERSRHDHVQDRGLDGPSIGL